jgi:antitoxin VapB
MALNIKNEETHRLARELAALQGVSIVVAVTKAVEEKLEREKNDRAQVSVPPMSRYDRLIAFSDECAKRIKNPIHSWEIDALLYGEDGLPK